MTIETLLNILLLPPLTMGLLLCAAGGIYLWFLALEWLAERVAKKFVLNREFFFFLLARNRAPK